MYLLSRGLKRVLQIKATSWQHNRRGRIVSVPMFRLAFPWKHLIKTTLFYYPSHGKPAPSNRSCINTQAQKHTTAFRNCLLLTEVKFFPSEKFSTYPKWEKSAFEIAFNYEIINYVCVLYTNIKYHPPSPGTFSEFRSDLEFGGLQ
jgi:hypothetical protein